MGNFFKYFRFWRVMRNNYSNYEWEPLDVVTEDGYKLTLFHVWHPDYADPSLGPVLWHHGDSMDAAIWLNESDEPHPAISMAWLGHDVYIANARATTYSRKHEKYLWRLHRRKYWDFDLDGTALDVVAELQVMAENTSSTEKGWLYAYSSGTTASIIALAKHEAEVSNYIHRAILLAPCIIPWEDT